MRPRFYSWNCQSDVSAVFGRLLLHGPPGTGKTSLIKSIASHTKRHIVDVPLSKV